MRSIRFFMRINVYKMHKYTEYLLIYAYILKNIKNVWEFMQNRLQNIREVAIICR